MPTFPRASRLALALTLSWAPAMACANASDVFVNMRGVSPVILDAFAGNNPDIDKLLSQPADLWERIRLGFSMPDLEDKRVTQSEAWLAARPDLVRAIVQRARRYLHFIVDEVERQGMPTELALLPFVESGFDPMALSPAQAAGLWQFIPDTGTKYNLEQTAHYDARRDVVASTQAALNYLKFLYEFNGKDWHRALASYNWGEQAVARAVERNRVRGMAIGFTSLTMPDETRNYVPRLQAIKNIVRDPAAFGIALAELPNEPAFAVVRTAPELDIKRAAELAEMSLDEFHALNPAFNRGLAPAALKVGLVLPLEKVGVFNTNIERYRDAQAVRERAAASRRVAKGRLAK